MLSAGNSNRKQKDNVEVNTREMRYTDMNWVLLAQDRNQWHYFVMTMKELWIPTVTQKPLE
jgi:hypothetical protein